MKLKALSLWQPWATLIAIGAKKIETRSWRTDYRGILLIHAAKHWTAEQQKLLVQEPFRKVLAFGGYTHGLPLGRALCLVRLLDVVPTETVVVTDLEGSFGDFTPGRYAWLLGEVKEAKRPFRMKGRQGLWDIANLPENEFVTWHPKWPIEEAKR